MSGGTCPGGFCPVTILNMYILVSHTNGQPVIYMIGMVMNCLVGMGLKGYGECGILGILGTDALWVKKDPG